jgi:hypothetical protein
VPNHGEFKKTNKKGISESLGIQDKQFTPHYPLQKLQVCRALVHPVTAVTSQNP